MLKLFRARNRVLAHARFWSDHDYEHEHDHDNIMDYILLQVRMTDLNYS